MYMGRSLSTSGGDVTTPSDVSASLTANVAEVFANDVAFVSLKVDGSIVAWGSSR